MDPADSVEREVTKSCYFALAVDCDATVLTAPKDMLSRHPLEVGDRIVKVEDVFVENRGELRAAILARSEKPKIPVRVVPASAPADSRKDGSHSGRASPNVFGDIAHEMSFSVAATNMMSFSDFGESDNNPLSGDMNAMPSYRLLSFAQIDRAQMSPHGSRTSSMGKPSFTKGLSRPLANIVDAAAFNIPIVTLVDQGLCASPVLQIEMLAKMRGVSMCPFDGSSKMKARPRHSVLQQLILLGMQCGSWLLFISAHKSLSMLRCLEAVLDSYAQEGKQAHPDARVFIICEPHPHFPPALLRAATVTRMGCGAAASRLILASNSKLRIQSMQKLTEAPTRKRINFADDVEIVVVDTKEAVSAVTASPTNGPRGAMKRVPTTAGFSGMSKTPDHDETDEEGISNAPGLHVRWKFFLDPDEKFLCGSTAGLGRFGIGSSSGNVYILDNSGLPLFTMNAHKACVWDVDFSSTYDLITASEDCSVMNWGLTRNSAGFESTMVSHEGGDVFASRYIRSGGKTGTTVVAHGGVSAVITASKRTVVKGGANDGQPSWASVAQYQLPSSLQGIASFEDSTRVICGCGNGTIVLWDYPTGSVNNVSMAHQGKVPAACAIPKQPTLFATGSYDKMCSLWDTRTLTRPTASTNLGNIVTGVDAYGEYLALCVERNLVLMDRRMMQHPVMLQRSAWKGFARGIRFDDSSNTGNSPFSIMTSSFDGCRLWKVVI